MDLRPYYQLASHPVHANPKGIYFSLGALSHPALPLTGATNFGFSQPGQSTAISLFQFIATMLMTNPTVDAFVAVRLIQHLSDEAVATFDETQAALAVKFAKFHLSRNH